MIWGLGWEGSFMIAWMVKSQRESRKVKKEKKRNGCEKEGPDGSPDSEKILGG